MYGALTSGRECRPLLLTDDGDSDVSLVSAVAVCDGQSVGGGISSQCAAADQLTCVPQYFDAVA